jgi:hypothetical protein
LSYYYRRWRRFGWTPYYGAPPYYPPVYPYYSPYGPMPPSSEAELRMLEDYKKELEEELQDLQDEIKDVDARIEELKKLLSKG